MNCYVKMQFDPDVAKEHGVEEAIMFSNIEFWCETNKKNHQNFHEGKYWMFNSQEAFVELFPFWTRRQIQRILQNLKKKGLITEGKFNKVRYDQTRWYTITKDQDTVAPYGALERTESDIRTNDSVQPIPDNKQDSKPIVLIESSAFDNFWQEYPKKELKKKTLAIWKREKLEKYLPDILVFLEKAKKTDRWQRGFIKQPPAFLNGRCWEDDLDAYGPSNKTISPGVYKAKSGLKLNKPIVLTMNNHEKNK